MTKEEQIKKLANILQIKVDTIPLAKRSNNPNDWDGFKAELEDVIWCLNEISDGRDVAGLINAPLRVKNA